MRYRSGAALILLLATWLGACSRNPSVLLDPAGPHAEKTAKLFWYFSAIESLVLVLVLGFLFYAISRRREPALVEPEEPAPGTERRLFVAVSIAVGITVLIL